MKAKALALIVATAAAVLMGAVGSAYAQSMPVGLWRQCVVNEPST